MQLTTCSKPAVQNLLQVCSSQFAASLQFTICSKSEVHNLQQVCSSQFAPSLPFATCSKSAVRNLQQACWQLAADLLSSSRSKRCERILISAWWSQLAASLQQTCCNLRVSGCVQLYQHEWKLEKREIAWKHDARRAECFPVNSINTGTITPGESLMLGWSQDGGNNYKCSKQF